MIVDPSRWDSLPPLSVVPVRCPELELLGRDIPVV